MTPREFRQEKEFEFDHFLELTSTGIKPNYVNIELFAQEYHKAKLNLLTIPVVSGMFSAEDVAEAFIDGQDYGMGNSDCKFNIENYR
jgi:hypothetical protein